MREANPGSPAGMIFGLTVRRSMEQRGVHGSRVAESGLLRRGTPPGTTGRSDASAEIVVSSA